MIMHVYIASLLSRVTEPTSNGIGGDNFAIVWYKNQLYGLNSSGPSPKLMTLENFKKK